MDSKSRDEAIKLIQRFCERKANELRKGNAEPYWVEDALKPNASTLTYYFGGSPRRWGSILKASAIPSKIELACLRCVISAKSLDDMRLDTQHLREVAEDGSMSYWITHPAHGAKKPIHRRDGGYYDMDSWNKIKKMAEMPRRS